MKQIVYSLKFLTICLMIVCFFSSCQPIYYETAVIDDRINVTILSETPEPAKKITEKNDEQAGIIKQDVSKMTPTMDVSFVYRPHQSDQFEDIPGAECVPQKQPFEALVERVVDGDTIQIRLNGERLKVRYIGIDAPESVKPDTPVEYYGHEATSMNARLVERKLVYLVSDVSDTDQYGRKLFYVFVDNIFVNYEMIRQGYAQSVTFPPDVACVETFKEAEYQARANELGLWAK